MVGVIMRVLISFEFVKTLNPESADYSNFACIFVEKPAASHPVRALGSEKLDTKRVSEN